MGPSAQRSSLVASVGTASQWAPYGGEQPRLSFGLLGWAFGIASNLDMPALALRSDYVERHPGGADLLPLAKVEIFP